MPSKEGNVHLTDLDVIFHPLAVAVGKERHNIADSCQDLPVSRACRLELVSFLLKRSVFER